jgi:3-hydroxy-3-methylglutaryl CoA synthase
MIGITSAGAYLPRMRLQRSVMAAANAWFDPSLGGLAKGERTMCNWDEDAITMGVSAAQDCRRDGGAASMDALFFASTSAPFIDRQNAGVLAEALNLGKALRTMDVGGSRRAATTATLAALDMVRANPGSNALIVASEHRRTRVGSQAEMIYGDGAGAISIGSEGVIAEFITAHTHAEDFVDQYRGEGHSYAYEWEERWVRSEGYLKLVPKAVQGLLEKANFTAADIKHFIMPNGRRRVPESVAKASGITADAVVDNLIDGCGETGAAHPMLLLVVALERAEPGDLILMTSFGQGCEALLFRATEHIKRATTALRISGSLARGVPEENYAKFQTFNGVVEREYGKRAESDKQTYLSAFNRKRELLTGFMGGKCSACGTVQIPLAEYCVSPECGQRNTQAFYPLVDARGEVKTYTADQLTFDMNPPAYFGLVEFEGGGRLMVDFTDVDPDNFDVGTKVGMVFRIKQADEQRGFKKYFWKAVPEQA